MLIEQGRALGAHEMSQQLATQLAALAEHAPKEPGPDDYARLIGVLSGLAASYADAASATERLANSARARAEELMAQLEHPGAVLARRLVATARAARAGWRGSR